MAGQTTGRMQEEEEEEEVEEDATGRLLGGGGGLACLRQGSLISCSQLDAGWDTSSLLHQAVPGGR